MVREFADRINFQNRLQVNRSEFVFGKTAGSSYIEAAMLSYGICDEYLLKNVARRLQERFKKEQQEKEQVLPWRCHVKDVEKTENTPESILALLTWLKDPGKSKIDRNPVSNSLCRCLQSSLLERGLRFS